MTIWFSADFHWGHHNILSYSSRPFLDVEDMNASLVHRFNEKVGADDLTYHLGDFALKEALVPIYLQQLKGKHILVHGNHDRTFPSHKKHERAIKRYLEYGFQSIHTELVLDEFVLHHMPYYDPDAKDQRYKQFRPVRQGNRVLLHGHIHNLRKYEADPPMLNVGCDVWDYYPCSIEEVRAFLAEQNNG